MPKFYNHETIEVLTYKDFTTKTLYVKIPTEESYGLNYYSDLDAQITELVQNNYISDSPVMFQVKFDYYKLKETEIEDPEYLGEVIKNLIISSIINKNEKMEREQRLGIPKNLKSSRISDMSAVNMVNHKLFYNIFNIELLDENDMVIERAF